MSLFPAEMESERLRYERLHPADLDPFELYQYVERFGGRKEGRIRNDVVIDGEPRDSIRYSITSDEWTANRDR